MARLEAEVTANIGPFERALTKATEKAREFAEKTKEATKEATKEVGGGQLFNLAGFAGVATSVAAFAGAIKESLEAFGHMETEVLRLKATVKDADVAKEVHEWIESIALNTAEIGHLESAFISLSESGMELEAIKPVLVDLQAVAFKSGESVDSLTEAFRRAKAGGLDAGEGAAKLLKIIPGLATEIDKYKEAAAKKVEFEAYWGSREELAAADKKAAGIRAMTPADFVKAGMLNTDVLTKLIHEMAPREAVTEARGTLEGAEGRLLIILDNLKESFGAGLKPAVEELVKDLTDNLPSIETNLKEFGAAIGQVVKFMEGTSGLGPAKPESEKRFLDFEKDLEDRFMANIAQSAGLGGLWKVFFPSHATEPAALTAADLANKEQQQKTNALLEDIGRTLENVFVP